MPTSTETMSNSEMAATLLRLFDDAVLRNEARQQQAATMVALSEMGPSVAPAQWGVGIAPLEALARFAGYPDLASACDRLVMLEAGLEAERAAAQRAAEKL
ncbi:hypothetical protein JMJ56_32030 [Belnapia sp. T18]|uniref:Uncharacterized protein n=1 Tax=Belnapia arida TaxID=2804533 RepID=A0ABS1UD20_9PROT|nr:hypothetical protein [Belnapia arida]MBL6082596.1 hypothetical protein [Belnapia arida]